MATTREMWSTNVTLAGIYLFIGFAMLFGMGWTGAVSLALLSAFCVGFWCWFNPLWTKFVGTPLIALLVFLTIRVISTLDTHHYIRTSEPAVYILLLVAIIAAILATNTSVTSPSPG